VEHQLTATDLLRMAGGEAYWRGVYLAMEGLANEFRVEQNVLSGSVFGAKGRPQVQLAAPFESRCSCRKGGNCQHVVALGLLYLHREREQGAGRPFSPEEDCYYLVSRLAHYDLRGLALQLLAAVPEAIPVAIRYLDRPGQFMDSGDYALDDDDSEVDEEEDWEEECV
jgi:uncharacterized Zn finger protein